MSELVLAVPVFNAARYLAATLQSLNAEGPTVRWWLQDGLSTDATIEIARRHARPGDTIRSEKDAGQADAINRAMHAMGGDIIGFINGDDLLAPNTPATVLDYFAKHPDVDLIYGNVEWIDPDGKVTGQHSGKINSLAEVLNVYKVWWQRRQWVQPEVFFRRTLFEKAGGFDTSYHLAFDYDFWVRCFLAGARVAHIPQVFAKFRIHPAQKSTAAEKASREIRTIVAQHLDTVGPRVGKLLRKSLSAQLSYDRYRLGEMDSPDGKRPGFFPSLIKNPSWLLSPFVRRRLQTSLAKWSRSAKTSPNE